MKSLVHFPQLLVGNMGINLSSRDGRMAEHSLHRTDIGTVDEQICGERMTQGVRMDIFDQAGFGRVEFDDALDRSWGQSQIVFVFGRDAIYRVFLIIFRRNKLRLYIRSYSLFIRSVFASLEFLLRFCIPDK